MMTECEVCRKDVLMPFECNFCGGYFCEEHRLPENHDCKGAPSRTPLGSYQSKQTVAKEKTRRGAIGEKNLHLEREAGYVQRRKRSLRVRPWHLFLLILFAFGMVLFCLAEYYTYVLGDFGLGWEFGIYSAVVLGVLLAIGLLYLERWWRRHMRRFWGE